MVSVFLWCAWLWDRASIDGQLFTFNNHRTFHIEAFVFIMLYCSKANSWSNLNIEKKITHLNMQHLKICHYLASFKYTQIIMTHLKKKISLCTRLDPLVQEQKPPWHTSTHNLWPPNLHHKFEKKTFTCTLRKWLPDFFSSIKKILELHSSSVCF
jgi:hypothetical protein